MKRKFFVTPAKAGVQVVKNIFNAWIPAFAGMTVLLVNSDLMAMASRPSDPNAPPPPAWAQWMPIVVMVAVFYFLIIRPQSRQRKERDNMITNLKKGDKIVTNGGLIATVVNVTGDVVDIKLNEETKVKLRKSGIAEVIKEPVAEAVVVS